MQQQTKKRRNTPPIELAPPKAPIPGHSYFFLFLRPAAGCGACPGFPPLLLPSPDAAFRLLPPPWRNSCLRLMNSVAKWLISGLAPKYAEKYDRISDGSLRSRQK